MSKQTLIFITGLLWFHIGTAASLDYSALLIKDLDEMRETVQQSLDEAEIHINDDEDAKATEKLRESLKTILSRPNGDNMVKDLVPMLRGRMRDLNAFEDTLMGLADEAIYALTEGKEKPRKKATNLIVLENIISEFRPEVKANKEIKKVFVKIRDAKVKVPKEVKNELRLRGMYKTRSSPSLLAEKIIGKQSEEK